MKLIKVIGFDLDGTLVKMKLDFRRIRKELGIPDGDTLGYISSLPEQEARRLINLLKEREMEAADLAEPAEGMTELLEYCRDRKVKVVVITRNSGEATERTLKTIGLEVDMIISRDHAPPKPSPDAINIVLNHYGIEPREMAYIGDYLYDVQAGNAAGVKTILISGQEGAGEWAPFANYVAEDLYEVLDILKEGRSIGG
jgi:HAD superfamily hydrolase (TIGR01509 family)